MEDSALLEAAYTVKVKVRAPTASPEAGEVPLGTGVILSTATEEAEIYYTANGTAPGRTSARYTGAISIDSPVVIKAIAVKEGMTDSDVLETAYTVPQPEIPEEEPETPVATRLEIASLPNITFYAKGQAFDPAGLGVNEVYSDGSVRELLSYTVDPVNTARAGQKMVYVRSGTLTAYFSVYVDSSDVVLQNIVFKRGPSKTVYELGENFSKNGILFTAIYSDGSEQDLDGGACSYSGYDRTKRGLQSVALKVNSFTYAVDVTVKVPASATVSLNSGGSDILDTDYRHVYIKTMPLEFDKLNLKATVTANGVTVTLKGGEDFALEEINLRGYNASVPGKQTLSFDLDDKKELSFWVYVADVEPAVWFDYGYKRKASDPEGVGPGTGKYYAQPGETLVLAPVRYLVGWNDDHTPGTVSYSWSVTGGSCTGVSSASGETYAFTPAAEGSYTVTAQITGRNYITGGTMSLSTVTEVVCYTGTVDAEKTFASPLRNPAPGQFGYLWTLGAAMGYEVWTVEPQESYQIRGNPFFGWSEPGVVWMQEDRNNNGVPDEMWYELVGEQEGPRVTRRYALTYMLVGRYVLSFSHYAWVDCKGRRGILKGVKSAEDRATYTGTLLNDNGKIAGASVGPGGWGYVDSWSSHTDWDYFYPSNAIRADGSPANLDAVRFIKVHTGLFMYGDVFGENSTEIQFADFLPDQSGGFSDPVDYD
jgi:hypothetical protein